MKTLLVAGGNVSQSILQKLVEAEEYQLICGVDKGTESLKKAGIKPNILIGDFDSCCQETLKSFEKNNDIEIISLNPEKDDTDTEYSVRKVIEKGATDITILGATGTRIDHVLANIAVLYIGIEKSVKMCLLDANNKIRMVDKELTIKRSEQYGKYVSVIPYTEKIVGLNETGFKYTLDNFELTQYKTMGVSNEIISDEAKISFKEGLAIVIESKD